ncbi:dihydrofolate reductase [Bacillus mesophilus]|uniref:Dihydrofolate reductase n=1 Tax=Bacillus mesophilus TaxID=1808955 RepID=A0A6M0QDQ9_9BACI|nr:dihydrofolate reductase [Bacillus mesophilus]MBM7663212.1 dihydrofolate reductase [Bacillus mesophilus]NEY73949.1 dihydrofolate reductase [Bacillus mesophilus]
MISYIVAMDENQVIGRNNELPWHLPADLAYFKRVTMGKPIIMGRKTHESIGRALPGRENIIVTRNESYQSAGCRVVHSMDEVRELENEMDEELFVIGGAELFKELLPVTDRLYITHIHHEFQGDTFFPSIDWENWVVLERELGIKDEKNPYDFEYVLYERKK